MYLLCEEFTHKNTFYKSEHIVNSGGNEMRLKI